MADRTAPLMLHRAAALGTGAALVGGFLDAGIVTGGLHVGLDRLGYGIGAGEHLAVAEAGRTVAGDAEELLDDVACLHAAPPGEGDHAAESLRL